MNHHMLHDIDPVGIADVGVSGNRATPISAVGRPKEKRSDQSVAQASEKKDASRIIYRTLFTDLNLIPTSAGRGHVPLLHQIPTLRL
jgi:hypothetical protein